ASRAQVHQLIRSVVADAATVLLTTQYLEEADRLASRLAVIDHGRVIAEGTPSDLKASAGARTLRIRLARPAQRPEAKGMRAQRLSAPVGAGAGPRMLPAKVPAGPSGQPASERVTAALSALAGAGIAIGEFAFGQPSMDEVFLALTGHTGTIGQAT